MTSFYRPPAADRRGDATLFPAPSCQKGPSRPPATGANGYNLGNPNRGGMMNSNGGRISNSGGGLKRGGMMNNSNGGRISNSGGGPSAINIKNWRDGPAVAAPMAPMTYSKSYTTNRLPPQSQAQQKKRVGPPPSPSIPSWSLYREPKGDPNVYRPAKRPLILEDDEDWFEEQLKKLSSDSGELETVKHCNDTWRALIERDTYMDVIKKFNASNLQQLKAKRGLGEKRGTPAEFESVLKSCVQEPGLYPQTWAMLSSLYSEEALIKYVEQCPWFVGSGGLKMEDELLNRLRGTPTEAQQPKGVGEIANAAEEMSRMTLK